MSEHQLLLLQAIEKGHTSIVLKLLRNHISVDVKDMFGRTPLMIVCFMKSCSTIVGEKSTWLDSILGSEKRSK
jgi:hypothetical protein